MAVVLLGEPLAEDAEEPAVVVLETGAVRETSVVWLIASKLGWLVAIAYSSRLCLKAAVKAGVARTALISPGVELDEPHMATKLADTTGTASVSCLKADDV